MTIDELIDLQEVGGRARLLGLPMHDNPYVRPQQLAKSDPDLVGDRAIRHDAWKFGWEVEDAALRIHISRRFNEDADDYADAHSFRARKGAALAFASSNAFPPGHALCGGLLRDLSRRALADLFAVDPK